MTKSSGIHLSEDAPSVARPARALVPPGRWVVDPAASVVGFSVRHLAVATVRGRFTRFEGWIEAEESGAARAGGCVEVASLDTGMEARDARLLSGECFDVDRHPVFRFEAAAPAGAAPVELTGDLTLMGRTRPVTLLAERRAAGAGRVRIAAHGVVRRRDFGLRWSNALEAGGAVVSDRVTIRLDVSGERC